MCFSAPFSTVYPNPITHRLFDMEVLKQASAHGIIDKRVMALGGITTENMAVAKELGFGGVVVLGDLWNRFNIHSTLDYKELINHFRKLRKAAD